MTISNTERDRIMGYLGWPVNPDSLAIVQDAINQMQASTDAESRLRDTLTTIATIETQIAAARNAAGSPYTQLLSEAQRNCYTLSNALGLEIKRKVFS